MKSLDLTFASPAENLAADEAMLDQCDAGGDEVLRFWESPIEFVVVGYSNAVDSEVNAAACRERGIPVHRRCTGGGTVVQGPGCLNYALALRTSDDGPLRNIAAANRHIMDRIAASLQTALAEPVEVLGHTDLAIRRVKFSGNAQRRKRHALLFHGTFLIDFNLGLIDELLRMPTKQPDYRQGRGHREFVRNLRVSREAIKRALTSDWNALEPADAPPRETIDALVREKYATPDWNLRF